ncbi:MAG: hypothetical protein LE180_05520, partial [Endomicrobium sp.]|uniref:hypothetical protein n=1 Tax=Candidatus Endomicrobiellum pyrsonymphae TaxID=1408203 RepID=UPI003587CC25|nr:hypothetical protein [Endomicrobium sp.]
ADNYENTSMGNVNVPEYSSVEQTEFINSQATIYAELVKDMSPEERETVAKEIIEIAKEEPTVSNIKSLNYIWLAKRAEVQNRIRGGKGY